MRQAHTHDDHYQIQTDNGTLKRVNVEHGLVDDTPIVKLIRQAERAMPELKPKAPSDLHVTLFHFGKPEDLYNEIVKLHDLDFDAFYHAFLVLMAETENVVPQPVPAVTKGLRLLGNHDEPVLGVELHDLPVLDRAHAAIEQHFHHFLTAMGVADLPAFLAAIHYFDRFLPHISLGRLPSRLPLPDVPAAGLEVILTPSRLRNVKVLEEGRWVWSR